MAKLFVSNTSSDREWTDWICEELSGMGHELAEHKRNLSELKFTNWISCEQEKADHTVCVYSEEYKIAHWSKEEFERAADTPPNGKRNFCLIVKVRPSDVPYPHNKRSNIVELFGKFEDNARAELKEYIDRFVPTDRKPSESTTFNRFAFPGRVPSNLPLQPPRIKLHGRDNIADEINKAFETSESFKAVTLFGDSGSGKSAIARAYADTYKERYRVCWWVHAASKNDREAALADLAIQLGWMEPDAQKGFRIDDVLELLKTRGRDILLIYDDADGPWQIRPALPESTEAHILITSNARDWARWSLPIGVKGWSREKGGEFLVFRIPATPDERPIAEDLSDELDGLPLALEMAGAYCAQVKGIALKDYAQLYREKEKEIFGEGRSPPPEYREHRASAPAFDLALEAANLRHPAAEPLLCHMASLARGTIPLSIFAEGGEKLAEPLRSQIANDGLDDSIKALCDFNLISHPHDVSQHAGDIATKSVQLHRAIRAMASARLSQQDRDRTRGEMIAALAAVFPENDGQFYVSWSRARSFTPHALQLLGGSLEAPTGFELDASDLMYDLAQFSGASQADLKRAKKLLERSLELRQAVLAKDDPRIASSFTTLALLINTISARDPEGRARNLARQAVAMCERLAGPDDPSVGVALINLGRILSDGYYVGAKKPDGVTPEIEEAQQCCIRALGIFPCDKPGFAMNRAFTLSVLGRILTTRGMVDAASSAIEEALDLYQREFGQNHPAAAANLVNMADILLSQGHTERARDWLKKAKLIYVVCGGPEMGAVANCEAKLAETFICEGHNDEGRAHLRRSYNLSFKVLGGDHPLTKARDARLQSLRSSDSA
jgi:tetratricopeptide (TPR) repeat protein